MKDFFSVPNILSYIRIALVPVFAILFLTNHTMLALAIFLIASVTDAADGFIARKFNLITNIGKVLDPFADKLLKITVLSCFVYTNLVPIWFLVAMLVVDLTLVIFASVLFKREIIIKSNIIGKAGTIIIAVGVLLTFFASSVSPAHLVVLYSGLAVVVASAISYLITYLNIKNK